MFRKKKETFYYVGQEVPIDPNDKYKCLDMATKGALQQANARITFVMVIFGLCFAIIAGRLFQLSVMNYHSRQFTPSVLKTDIDFSRYNILDRNGMILATSVPTKDLSVNPKKVKAKDKKEIARNLASVLKDVSEEEVLKKLNAPGSFQYIKRKIIPQEQQDINWLGYYFLQETPGERRVYPQGNLFSHLLGTVDIDNYGTSGLEKAYDKTLQHQDLVLSVDITVQEIVRKTMIEQIEKYKATGGMSLVMDVRTGEVIASVSLPDYDPNLPLDGQSENRFNKATLGVYEFGSVFKLFTVAMALDNNVIKPTDSFDATKPIKVNRKIISDFRGQNRSLLVPEVLIHSSNIGAYRIASKAGYQKHREFLKKVGFYEPLPILLPERARTQVPRSEKWSEITSATVSYGYGISVSPLHIISAVSALVNGGYYRVPTFLKDGNKGKPEYQVVSEKTSQIMRHMMWGVINWQMNENDLGYGYAIGGKTGTANLIKNGKYVQGTSRTTFVGAFPMNDPKYAVMVTLEEPKVIKETRGYNNAGWNAKPTGLMIMERISSYLGIAPDEPWTQPNYMKKAITNSIEAKKAKRR